MVTFVFVHFAYALKMLTVMTCVRSWPQQLTRRQVFVKTSASGRFSYVCSRVNRECMPMCSHAYVFVRVHVGIAADVRWKNQTEVIPNVCSEDGRCHCPCARTL